MNSDQQIQFEKAQQALDQHQYSEAARILAPLNDEVDLFVINHSLVKALYEMGQYRQAWSLVNEHLADYQQSAELTALAVQVALVNHQMINARKLALASRHDDRLLTQIDQAEDKMRETMQQSLQGIQRRFIHLGDQAFNGQQERFHAADQLPLNEYVQAAKYLVHDPFVRPLIRASIIQNLQQLQVKEIITIYWIDEQEYSVDLAKLKPVDEYPIVIEVQKLLSDRYGQSDPMTLQTYLQEFYLQLTLLYPRIEETIVDAQAWYVALCAYSQTANVPAIQAAKEWQNRLTKLINRMM